MARDEDAVLRMKYTNEFRAAFGTGIRINPITGEREAVPLKYFEYTGCLLQYVDKCEKAYEAQRVDIKTSISAKAGTHHNIWYPKVRQGDAIYESDVVTVLKGIGEKKTGPILNLLGFKTVGDIKGDPIVMALTTTADVNAWLVVAKEKDPRVRDVNMSGFAKAFCSAIQEAKQSINGEAPRSVDYRKVDGCPYAGPIRGGTRNGQAEGRLHIYKGHKRLRALHGRYCERVF